MQITRLSPSCAPAYRALMLQAYAAHPHAFTSTHQERAAMPLQWWEARLGTAANAKELVLAARDGENLFGVAGLAFETREKLAHKATLFGMYVLPAQRGAGLGRHLLQAALLQARERAGVQLVQLTVSAGNRRAETLYRQGGFVPFGLEPHAVAVEGRFIAKLHMWCRVGTGLPS